VITFRAPDPVLVVIAALDGLLVCPSGMYPDAQCWCGVVGLRYDAARDGVFITHPGRTCELGLHPEGEAAADFAEYVQRQLMDAVSFGDYSNDLVLANV
jgi:hypothetical protein